MVYDIFPSGSFSKTKTCIIIVICRNRAIKKFISLPGSAGTKLVKISLCVFLIILSTYIYEGIVNFNNSYYSLDSDQIVENNSVKILFWTEYYQKNPLTKLPQGEISKNYTYKMIKCPMVSHCLFTTNRSELHESDGIVFHASDLTNDMTPDKDFPKVRNLSIPWIVLHEESPIYTWIWLDLYNSIFNWTMSYRTDSDIYFPYGKIIPIENNSPKALLLHDQQQLFNEFPNKTGKVAWTVSHCKTHSQRQRIASELGKYIDLHIYGDCGARDCLYKANDGCHKQLESTYKFYLAFENSLCHEYISEKFFSTLNHALVPIVFGSGPYETIAPPHSYIDVKNFTSIRKLGEYLQFLDTNPEEYFKYFEWKKHYRVEVPYLEPWCQLCHKLLQYRKHHDYRKWYSDIGSWYMFMPQATSADLNLISIEDMNNETTKLSGPPNENKKLFKNLTKACTNPWDFIELP